MINSWEGRKPGPRRGSGSRGPSVAFHYVNKQMKMNIMPPDQAYVSTNPPLIHTMFSLDKTSRNPDIEPVNRTLANHAPLGGWCLTQRHPLGVVLVSRQGPLPCRAASVSGKGGHLFHPGPPFTQPLCGTASAQSKCLLPVLPEVLPRPAVTGCLGNESRRMAQKSHSKPPPNTARP